VLCSHDINDLFLEIGKTFVYRERKTMVNIWFGVIIVSWVALRLVFFPFVVIRSTIFESIQHIPIDIFPFYYSLNASLLFLVVLHVYWFGLMIRMLVRVLRGQEKGVVDSREEKVPGSPKKSAPTN
jgi:ceramide synthetase